jgi:uncharacterized alkaline shock family protein YloU
MPARSAEEQIDPDAVSTAALSCPQVARLSGGFAGEVATYLPGRSVSGVRLTDDEVEVHIVARWGLNLPEVADAVREAVRPVAGGLRVSVYVEDIEVPDEPDALAEQGAGSGTRP